MTSNRSSARSSSSTTQVIVDKHRVSLDPDGSIDPEFVKALRAISARHAAILSLQITVGAVNRELYGPHTSGDETFLLLQGEIAAVGSRVPYLWQAARIGALHPNQFIEQIESGLEHEVHAATRGVVLDARREMDLILEPWLAAQFIHESVGHSLEHDNFEAYGTQAGWRLGMQLSGECLQVFDDPTQAGLRGSYAVDDEGTPAERVCLIRDGRVSDTLTSKECGSRPNGHGRVSREGNRALPRSAVTIVGAGSQSQRELISEIELGALCVGVWGGGSQGDTFVVRPVYARLIRDGHLTDEYLRKFDLVGLKSRYLSAVDCVANDVQEFQPFFGCVKDDGRMIPISFRAPSIRLRNVPIHPIAART
jgi:predicted Zn-dependent protease